MKTEDYAFIQATQAIYKELGKATFNTAICWLSFTFRALWRDLQPRGDWTEPLQWESRHGLEEKFPLRSNTELLVRITINSLAGLISFS